MNAPALVRVVQGKSSKHKSGRASFPTELKQLKEYNTSCRGLTAHATAQGKYEREHAARVLWTYISHAEVWGTTAYNRIS